MSRRVVVVVASLSAFMLAQIAHETVEAGLAQEHATARAAPTLSGHELASQASSALITTLVPLADERATQVKSDSLATTMSTSGGKPAALSEIHAGSTRAATRGTTRGRTVGVVVRSAKQGGGSCIVFDNQAEFEAFNVAEGNVLKGIETFEEGYWGASLNDPLCGGIPNTGFEGGFRTGLDELNLCVQSNNLGANPTVPSPTGADGLVLVEFGSGFGESSDIVLAGYFVESFDIMFGDPVPPDQQDNHTGVGFDVVSLFGGGVVAIRVFDKNNVERVSTTSQADPAGSNFWGVWCPDTIGRINIFDTGGGAEAGDNIQMWFEAGVCGDGKCTGGEDCESCPQDCGICPFCGDGEVNQPSEECDPPGFPSTCPNNEACLPGCTCGDVCGDGLCSGDENECDCPQDCPGECPCIVFTNQADFEAFNEEEGKLLKGIEGFEEPPPRTGIVGFDDPLCGGIPNGPFPNGIDQLNLCVQANLLGGAADVPAPHGPNGLVFVESCDIVECLDFVLANYFVESFDLMFGDPVPPDQQDNHTGVGFDTVTMLGGNSVEIRVFDKNNVEMVSATSPADEAGNNFWGVWCEDTIGRINIFDPANGAQGGDNIQMWVTPGKPVCGDDTCDPNEDCESCPGDCGQCPSCVTFNTQAEFEAFNMEHGNAIKGIEDFEGTPPGADFLLHDPLCGGIPQTPFRNGLDQLNLCVQSNLLGGAPDVPSPRGAQGLLLVQFGSGFGESSDIVVTNYFADSLDVMFGDPVPPDQQDNHTGVGFDPVSIFSGGTVAIRVFDKNNVEMVSTTSPVDTAGSNFWGAWCSSTIGRINIFDTIGGSAGAEGADNIQMWVEADECGLCPTDVDGSGDTGAADLAVLLGSWGPCAPSDPCECLDADSDGVIGAADLAVLLGAWGPCP